MARSAGAAGGNIASVSRGAIAVSGPSIASKSFSPIVVRVGGGERAGSGISPAEAGIRTSPSRNPSIKSVFGSRIEAVKVPNPDSQIHDKSEVVPKNTQVIVQGIRPNPHEGLFGRFRLSDVRVDLGTPGQVDKLATPVSAEVPVRVENSPPTQNEVSLTPARPLRENTLRVVSEIAVRAVAARLNVDPVVSSDEKIAQGISGKKGSERVAEKVRGALIIIRGSVSAQNIIESVRARSFGDFIQRRKTEEALRAANMPVALAETATNNEALPQAGTGMRTVSSTETQTLAQTQVVLKERPALKKRLRTIVREEVGEKIAKKKKTLVFILDEENLRDRVGQSVQALKNLAEGNKASLIDPREILSKIGFAISAAVRKIKGIEGEDGTIKEFDRDVGKLRPDTLDASTQQVVKIVTDHRPPNLGSHEANKDITTREVGEALGQDQEASLRRIIVTEGAEEVIEQQGTVYTIIRTETVMTSNKSEEIAEETGGEKELEEGQITLQPILRPLFGQRPLQTANSITTSSSSFIKDDLKIAA